MDQGHPPIDENDATWWIEYDAANEIRRSAPPRIRTGMTAGGAPSPSRSTTPPSRDASRGFGFPDPQRRRTRPDPALRPRHPPQRPGPAALALTARRRVPFSETTASGTGSPSSPDPILPRDRRPLRASAATSSGPTPRRGPSPGKRRRRGAARNALVGELGIQGGAVRGDDVEIRGGTASYWVRASWAARVALARARPSASLPWRGAGVPRGCSRRRRRR